MPNDALIQISNSLSELKRMHQLNFELLEQLNVSCDFILNNYADLPNNIRLSSLLAKSASLLAEIQADEPKILQYKTHLTRVNMNPKTDDKLTEPKKATA